MGQKYFNPHAWPNFQNFNINKIYFTRRVQEWKSS